MQHMSSSIKNKRILLAEDCEDSREILKFLFSKSGAEVETASNGSECVELALSAKAERRPFDIVLVDVHMPILDGNEAAKQLRKCGYTKPIVAITGQSTEEEKNQCMLSGCDAFLSKLTPKDKMIHILEDVLRDEEQSEAVDFEMPALPFVPKILETNPEYAPIILKFINNLDLRLDEIETLLKDKKYKNCIESCGDLSNSSFYGYQIFAERLQELQNNLEQENFDSSLHSLRMLKQASKSIKLGKSKIQKYISSCC